MRHIGGKGGKTQVGTRLAIEGHSPPWLRSLEKRERNAPITAERGRGQGKGCVLRWEEKKTVKLLRGGEEILTPFWGECGSHNVTFERREKPPGGWDSAKKGGD